MNKKELLKYWVDSSDKDFQAMIHLLEKGDFTWSLFIGLDTISAFNLRARYDDYKMEFHKKCSKDFTEKWVNNIKEFREWIKKKLLK